MDTVYPLCLLSVVIVRLSVAVLYYVVRCTYICPAILLPVIRARRKSRRKSAKITADIIKIAKFTVPIQSHIEF